MAEPKTLLITVDEKPLDKIGLRYFVHVQLPTDRVVDIYYCDLFRPLDDDEWEKYARLSARIMAQQVAVFDPPSGKLLTHTAIKEKLNGADVDVKPKITAVLP